MELSHKVFLGTAAGWLIICGAVETFRIATYLKAPTDGDLFAQNLKYQLMVLGVFRLPLWLLVLLAVLAFEFAVFRRLRRSRLSEPYQRAKKEKTH